MGIIKRILTRTTVLSLAFTLGITAAGSHHIEATANSNGEFTDIASTVKVAAISDPKPDLIVQDITLSPTNPSIGDTITITVTIKNQGTAVAGSSHVTYYINDIFQTSGDINQVNPGATAAKTFTWTAQVGSHTIKAVADSDAQVTESDETNNTKTFIFTTLAPDLIVTSISWSPLNPSRGDSITFSVIIKNQGSGTSRSSRVNLYIDGNSRGYQDVYSLDAGGTLTRTYTWVASVGQHTIKAAVDEDNTIRESNETNNELNVTFSTLPPDLFVEDITWTPNNPSKNDTVTFIIKIKNQGSGRSDACPVAYYFDGTFLNSDLVSPIEAGASTNMTFAQILLADSQAIKVTIDPYQQLTESDKTNNEKTVTLAALLPDLVIRDITWSPTEVAVGDNVTFTVIIKNQGTGKAESSRLAYYIGSFTLGYVDVPAINAGSEVTKTFLWKAAASSCDVSVVADSDEKVIESNEINNKKTVSISTILPDLIVQKIAWSPENPSIGDTVTFTVTTKNQGRGMAENFRVAYYIDDVFMAAGFISQLPSEASANTTFTWKAQNSSHTFKAIADSYTSVIESNEDNNAYQAILSPIMPDLIIDSVTWSPADFSTGDKVNFDIKIKNQGSNMAGSFRVAYYVDGAIAGYQVIGQLDAGTTTTESFSCTATAGPHSIKIVGDSSNQVTENDETNNVKTVNIPPPDLVVQDITCSPAKASVGDKVSVTVTIKNQGAGKAGSSRLSYYIDGGSGGYQDIPEIDSNAIVTKDFIWVATAGQHIINVAADFNNQITESDETNNEKKINTSTLTPDLIIQGISWSLDNPLTSDNATLTVTIKNQGSGKAGSSRLTYYVDGVAKGYQDMPEIDADAVTTTKDFTWVAKTGQHTIKAVADSTNQVVESEETNNEKTLNLSTIVPDLLIQNITWSPTEASVGDTLTFTVKTKNQGIDKAINPRVTFYIDGSSIGAKDIPQVNAGALATETFTWTSTTGSHDIKATVDPDNMIIESNEDNNTKHLTLSLPATKRAANPTAKPTSNHAENKGILGDLWWLLCLGVLVLGGIAFIAAMKSAKR